VPVESLADIPALNIDVRFTPESGYRRVARCHSSKVIISAQAAARRVLD
jgi:hypothetical protein